MSNVAGRGLGRGAYSNDSFSNAPLPHPLPGTGRGSKMPTMKDSPTGTRRVRLGRTELSVSPVCFGTWQLSPRFWGEPDEEQIVAAIRRSIDVGVNFFDTADAYGDGLAETVLGRAFAGIPRGKFIVATKVFWHMLPDGR